MRWLVIVAVAVRIAAAAILIAGPWTDEAAELSGWDVERFQELADDQGRHWVDRPVEYPPGSVIVVETLAVAGTLTTHRLLAALSLAADLGIAALLAGVWSRRAGAAYLLAGLPLVPMGLVRLDLWAVGLAVVGAAALARRWPWLFAAATAAGAMVKVWPALLIAAAIATGRRWSAAAGVGAMAACGLAWLAYAGWSLDPIDQVVSLRGASGWHVESVAGSVTALATGAAPELQLNAYRIGTISQPVVVLGRAVTIAAVAALALLGHRALQKTAAAPAAPAAEEITTTVLALVMTGGTAALIVTAPLLSPQFLLWLTPWVALLHAGDRHARSPAAGSPAASGRRWATITAWLAASAIALTGVVLSIYHPADLAGTVPAGLLLARDGLLAGAVAASLAAARALGRPSAGVRQHELSGGAERPLGDRSPSPGPAGPDPQVDEVADVPGGLAG
jgi:hypothetical protein